VLPEGTGAGALAHLPPEIRAAYLAAVVAALQPVFLIAASIAAVAFLLTLALREIPLRGVEPEGMSISMPRDATSLEELERIINTLLAHENRWRVYDDLAKRAQLDLSAPELWMLARLGERMPCALHSLAGDLSIPVATLEGQLNALCGRGIAEKTVSGDLQLTADGVALRDRVLEARRQGLADLIARWEPEKHPDVLALLNRMVEALVADLPLPGANAPSGEARRAVS
jgi:hypothetical protein